MENLKARGGTHRSSPTPPVPVSSRPPAASTVTPPSSSSSSPGVVGDNLVDKTTACCVRVSDLIDQTMPAAPRPGNPADRRRVWTWAVVLSILTVLMFAGVSRHSADPTLHMREAKWNAPSSSSSPSSPSPPSSSSGERFGETATAGGARQKDADIGPMLMFASVPKNGDEHAPAGAEAEAAADADAEPPERQQQQQQQQHERGAQVTPLRSKGTLCVRREHYLPEYVEAPPPQPAAKDDGGKWPKFAEQLARDAAASKARLVLLGDSITEAWRGTSKGEPDSKNKRGPELLKRELGEFDPLALAISGDQTQHLLWRLENGGFPTATPPEYVAVMIGTNDIGAAVRNVKVGARPPFGHLTI